MITANAGQWDWLAEAAEVQALIEATNARIAMEWGRLRAAGAGLPERCPRLETGGLAVDAGEGRAKAGSPLLLWWLAGIYEMEVGSIKQCLSAIKWRLDAIMRWIDTVVARLPDGPDLREEEVVAVLRSVRPSIDRIEGLFQEIREYLIKVNRHIRQMNRIWQRAAGRVLTALMCCAAGAALGTGVAILADWIGKM